MRISWYLADNRVETQVVLPHGFILSLMPTFGIPTRRIDDTLPQILESVMEWGCLLREVLWLREFTGWLTGTLTPRFLAKT